jgi:hypothetical protein
MAVSLGDTERYSSATSWSAGWVVGLLTMDDVGEFVAIQTALSETR